MLGVLLAAVIGVAAAVAGVGWSGEAIPAAAGFVPPPHKNHDGSGKTRIGIIGDSVGTTIAFNNAWAPLDKYDYSFDAAGCRRVYATSCKHPPPLTAVATMQKYRGQWGSLLVMLTGYNDMSFSFAEAVDAVMAEAARQGIPRVMWLTYRTADVRCVPLSYRSTATTFRDNNLILLQKAREYGGRLVIADWATYSTRYGSDPKYVSPDGVHMYPAAGSFALSQFIADNVGRVLAGEDVTPTCAQAGAASNTPWTFLRFGMGGTGVADAQRALIARGINLPTGADGYYNDLTVYAVQTFQRSVGLAPKGHIDEQTARALGLIGSTWPTVARGTTGAATVRLIETALIGRGIAVRGGVDGVFDVWLEYAVKTFQRQNGLAVSGIVDIATAARLGLTRAPAPGSVWTAVSNGSTGVLVSRAQQALVDHGIAVSSGVTGHFDLPTLYAVQTYQRHHGLLATGVVDVETARSLGLLDPDGNPVATWVDLGLGAAGDPVRTAERCLTAARINVADGVDGIFKLGDFYAVQSFQRWRSGGLPVTGRIDLASADRLGMLETPVPCAPPVAPLAATVAPDDIDHVDDVDDVDDRGGSGAGVDSLDQHDHSQTTYDHVDHVDHVDVQRPDRTDDIDHLGGGGDHLDGGRHDRPRPGIHDDRGSGPDRGDRGAGHDRGRHGAGGGLDRAGGHGAADDRRGARPRRRWRRPPRRPPSPRRRRRPPPDDRGAVSGHSVTPSPVGRGHRTLAGVRPPRDFFRPLAVGAPAPVRDIPLRPSRMIHFLPPSNPKMVAKVASIAPTVDVLLANLEDGIPASDKEAARAGLVAIGRAWDHPGTQLWTRVNSLDSPWALDDLVTAVTEIGDRLDVIMIPKVEGPEDIHYVDRLVAQLEARAGLTRPILLHAILETARGVANVEDICTASPRVQGLSLGPADLAANRRMKTTRVGGGHPGYLVRADPDPEHPDAPRPTYQQDLWHYTLARMVDACVAAGVLAYYGPFGDIADVVACEDQFRNAYLLGCVGAWSLHPAQIDIARRVFSPDPADVAHARRVIAAMGDGTGAVLLDGRMEDDASVKQCTVIVELAEQLARRDPELAARYATEPGR